MNNPWKYVMRELIGRKLAVFDDIANGRAIGNDSKTEEALGWLLYHRLVWRDGEQLIAREIPEAKTLWEKEGGNRQAGTIVQQIQTSEPTPPPAPERPRVHDHQTNLF
jgi:hypothetical protein